MPSPPQFFIIIVYFMAGACRAGGCSRSKSQPASLLVSHAQLQWGLVYRSTASWRAPAACSRPAAAGQPGSCTPCPGSCRLSAAVPGRAPAGPPPHPTPPPTSARRHALQRGRLLRRLWYLPAVHPGGPGALASRLLVPAGQFLCRRHAVNAASPSSRSWKHAVPAETTSTNPLPRSRWACCWAWPP